MRDDLWWIFGHYVNLPLSEQMKISGQYSNDMEAKQAFIHLLTSTHPSLSWILVANALYQMVTVYGGDSCHTALNSLQQLFPTGNVKYASLTAKK